MYLGPPVEGAGRPLKSDLQTAPYTSDAVNGRLRSDTLIWQSFSPEVRAEVLRRAQLVQLLQQVNPKLQLCQDSQSIHPPPQKVTAEKGIQVPDVRFGSAPYRPKRPAVNKPVTPSPMPNNTYTGPGIRIYNPVSQPENRFGSNGPNKDRLHGRAANRSFQHTRSSSAPRSYNRGSSKYPPRNVNFKQRRFGCSSTSNNPPPKRPGEETQAKENNENEQHVKPPVKAVERVTEKKRSINSNDKKDQNETQSSDDEESVTVVVEIKSEQELERKFGQFYCRRCRRGWSSKNVWCVKLTSKVYIKQTCNGCNKIVNPFSVTSQPGVTTKN